MGERPESELPARERLESWRATVVESLTRAIAVLGTPVALWAMRDAVRIEHWVSLAAIVAFAVSSIVCALTPAHARARAWWTMANFTMLVWVTTPYGGMHGSAGALVVGVAVVAALTLKPREAVVLPTALLGGLLLWGLLLTTGDVPRPPRESSDAGATAYVLRSLAVTAAITGISVLAISYLIQKLTRTFFESERLLQRRREAEAELIRAQKLETLGRVAGGVAHDVNNNLTVALAAAEIIEGHPGMPAELRELGGSIREACHNASLLSRQLLTLGRRELTSPELVDITALLPRIERLLRATLGSRVALSVKVEADLPPVYADPRQLEQVILNLAINARDALASGGSLTIRAEHGDASPDYRFTTSEAAPEHAVRIHVEDDGRGIEDDLLADIFDFFFTTKGPERGTGLGLAVTRAFAEASGGRVGVRTTVGEGSIFTLELPAASREPERAPVPTKRPQVTTVLVVDDDARVLAGMTDVLRAEGYSVLEASDGEEALERARSVSHIDLLCTDAIMPRLGGDELIRRFAPMHPEAHVLVCSAYTNEPRLRELVRAGRYAALPKPFSPGELRDAVARALAMPAPAPVADASGASV